MKSKPHKIPKTKAIKAVGIELEGAWTRYYIDGKPSTRYEEGATIVRSQKPHRMKYDGSVRINLRDTNCHFLGEIASKPMQPRGVTSWVRRNQPDAANSTCGAHMHISTHSKSDYMCLTDKKFWKTFKEKMAKWGKKQNLNKNHGFWTRFEGKSTYCLPIFAPEQQLYNNSQRYTQINYCWDKHKTMEFRLLPIFESTDMQIDSFFELIKIVETYLENNKSYKKLWSVKESIQDYPQDFTTVYEESFNPKAQPSEKNIINNRSGYRLQSQYDTHDGAPGIRQQNQLEWNPNEKISLSTPQSDGARKTYYIVTASNSHLAPETGEHRTLLREELEQSIFEEEPEQENH